MEQPSLDDLRKANEESGLRLHYDHNCKICGVICAWCDSCGFAHCFNGHEHDGFQGRYISKSMEK
jgi:hypothetical protein